MASESGPAWAVKLHFHIVCMSFPFITFWSHAEFGDITVWSLAWDALQMALSSGAKRLQQCEASSDPVPWPRSRCPLQEWVLWVVFAALLSASAEPCVSLCPSCDVGFMFLVSQRRGAINNLKPNGSRGNAPFGFAVLILQADFRLHVFLICVFDKCLRLYYWGCGLGITRPGFIQRSKTNFQSDISPFPSSTGPVLKISWMLFPMLQCRRTAQPKTVLSSTWNFPNKK